MVLTTHNREELRQTGAGYSRFYHFEGEKYLSVTSIISNGVPKPFLVPWAAKLTAETAVEELELLNQLVANDPQGAVDWLKKAKDRKVDKAASAGTELHEVVERLALGEDITVHEEDPSVRDRLVGLMQFVEVAEPEFIAAEVTAFNQKHHYAGTIDVVLASSHPKLQDYYETDKVELIVDVKSAKGVYAENGLQMSAYQHSEFWVVDDKQFDFNSHYTIQGGAVLQLRPQSWNLVPLDTGRDMFRAFIRAAGVAHYSLNLRDNAVGPKLLTRKDYKN